MALSSPPTQSQQGITVLGPLPYNRLQITDAHMHVWIDKIQGVDEGNPVLNQYDLILKELAEYRPPVGWD